MILYEFSLYDTEGKFVRRVPCDPPFDPAPDVAIDGTRYYILMEDGTYAETAGVHWLEPPEVKHADPKPKDR